MTKEKFIELIQEDSTRDHAMKHFMLFNVEEQADLVKQIANNKKLMDRFVFGIDENDNPCFTLKPQKSAKQKALEEKIDRFIKKKLAAGVSYERTAKLVKKIFNAKVEWQYAKPNSNQDTTGN